jgi:16S rRNA (uracil1498-N3)-methyltransferase
MTARVSRGVCRNRAVTDRAYSQTSDTVCRMNLVLLEPDDLIGNDRARLQGRRLKHVREIHRAKAGDELRVGILGGRIGLGRIERMDENALEMTIRLDAEPPPGIPVRLILALPRPKVLNRTIASAVSMGIREIDLINSWRVEKAYWDSPRLSEDNLKMQAILGLEQAGDTVLPTIRTHRLFTPFVREELPRSLDGKLALLAHPAGKNEVPRRITQPLVLAVGPEGGFIDREVETFRDIGFTEVSLGLRILRVETALACLIGRLL